MGPAGRTLQQPKPDVDIGGTPRAHTTPSTTLCTTSKALAMDPLRAKPTDVAVREDAQFQRGGSVRTYDATEQRPTVTKTAEGSATDRLRDRLSSRCNHPIRHWEYTDEGGKHRQFDAAHLPLQGRRKGRQWASKGAAAYPQRMNQYFVDFIIQCINDADGKLPRRVLFLFSGREDRPDGIKAMLALACIECECVDTENAQAHLREQADSDLLAEDLWTRLRLRMQGGKYGIGILSPPCSTFSYLRGRGPGPRKVRSVEYPYGLPDLTIAEKEEVRRSNYFTINAMGMAKLAAEVGAGFLFEQPEPFRPEEATAFNLTEYADLKAMAKPIECDFDQCTLGAETTKPTRVVIKAPAKDGLIRLEVKGIRNIDPQAPIQRTPLKGPRLRSHKEVRELENREAIGGMRNPHMSITKCQLDRNMRVKTRNVLLRAIKTEPRIARTVVQNLHDKSDTPIPHQVIAVVRTELKRIWATDDTLPHQDEPGGPLTGVDADLMSDFSVAVKDPDVEMPTWFRRDTGAPFGAENPIEDQAGIFPRTGHEEVNEDLVRQRTHDAGAVDWGNYQSAEEDPEAVEELLKRMLEAGWARKFDTLDEVKHALQAEHVPVNKLGLIVKLRSDGSYKYRLIWDLLRSGINSCLSQGSRVILPRLEDAVNSVLDLITEDEDSDSNDVRILVFDISDAFHEIPLNKRERRFQVAFANGVWYIFDTLIFGSKAAPTLWGRVAAWLGRSISCLTPSNAVRVQVYVDDPLVALKGSTASRLQELCLILLWVSLVGLRIAWSKLGLGSSANWIGATLAISRVDLYLCVEVTIPAKKIDSNLSEALEILGLSMVSRRRLASYLGSMNFIAGLIIYLRAFLQPCWAALSDAPSPARPKRRKRAAEHMIHVVRFAAALKWQIAFLRGQRGSLTRRYYPAALRPTIVFTVDASPWGIGGVLFDDQSRPISYFADELTEADEEILGAVRGLSDHMTLWEGLVILVALRLWKPAQDSRAVLVHVKSDNISACRVLLKLVAHSPSMNQIARELALDFAECSHPPTIAEHVPGISNILADALSRLYAPEAAKVPTALVGIPRISVPPRPRQWWRSLEV